MNRQHKAIAKIPKPRQQDDIRWLVLVPDCQGWFLFMHKELEQDCIYDSWHPTREEALREAESHWGVRHMDWQSEMDF